MTQDYGRVVTAALTETRSKFALAEALAQDIPPRPMGPTPANDQSVIAHLDEARAAIIAAGGEPRATLTLKEYRNTALWVWTEVGPDFRWIEGVSFSAHNEARMAGMSYETFAALPTKTVDAIRRDAGTAGTDGPPARIVESWSHTEKVEATRKLLSDPGVAEGAMTDDTTSVNVAAARAKHVQQRNERQDEAARIRAPHAYQDGDVLAAQNSLGHVVEYLELAIKQIGQVPEHRRAEFFPRLVAEVDRLTSWLHSVVDGQSLDAGLAKLLEGGDER